MLLPLAWIPGPAEWIVLAGIALLLFGKRLPEVGRSLGKGIVEFKKGIRGIEDEIDVSSSKARISTPQQQQLPPQQQPYKFDPYTGQPVQQPANTSNQATQSQQ